MPLLVFFDFATAFPSVLHHWIFLVLQARGFDLGFWHLVRAIYFLKSSWYKIDGVRHFPYWVRSGVLQGCPLSGLIFVMIMDPFVKALERLQQVSIPQIQSLLPSFRHTTVRVCADDVGAALATILRLPKLHFIFQFAEKFAGLHLKAKKCIIVPIGSPFFAMKL